MLEALTSPQREIGSKNTVRRQKEWVGRVCVMPRAGINVQDAIAGLAALADDATSAGHTGKSDDYRND